MDLGSALIMLLLGRPVPQGDRQPAAPLAARATSSPAALAAPRASDPPPADEPERESGSVSVRLAEPAYLYWVGRVTFGAAVEFEQRDPVVRVEFFIDGVPAGLETRPPWRIIHDFGDSFGSHRISIVATTASGATATAQASSLPMGPDQSTGVDLILVPVSVRGADGLPVRDLGRDDFALYDDGVRRPIASFDSEPTPVSLALAMDCSGSMSSYFPLVKAATIRFAEKLPPFFSLSLIGFADRADRVCDFTFNRAHIYAEVNQLRAGGETALLQACRAAIASLRARPGRRAAAVFTDGQDSLVSEKDYDRVVGEVLSEARDAGVMFYFVGYNTFGKTASLERIASGTGGRYLPAGSGTQITDAFKSIGSELNSQYTLGFEPSAAQGARGPLEPAPRDHRDRHWHAIRVEIAHPGMTVVARPGYSEPAVD